MKHQLHIAVDEELKERLRETAERENRSMSNMVESIVRDYFSAKPESETVVDARK